VALVGEEPAVLAERARSFGHRVRVAGWTERADPDLHAEAVALDEDGRARFRWRGRDVRLRFRGRHHARNALLAAQSRLNDAGYECDDLGRAYSFTARA
jgi:UDP-N-acetylmuramyl pentapeptide synthase